MPEEISDKGDKSSHLLSFFAVLTFLAVIAVNFYTLYFQKNYDFIVETACDPAAEECFARDCSEEGACPPNELQYFKRYTISAKNFPMCEGEDCTSACETVMGACEQMMCEPDEEFGESCVFLPSEESSLEIAPESEVIENTVE